MSENIIFYDTDMSEMIANNENILCRSIEHELLSHVLTKNIPIHWGVKKQW